MEQTNGNKQTAVKKPLYKSIGFYIGIIIIAAVIIAGIKWYQGTLEFVTTDDAFVDADRLELGAKILGRITDLYFAEGDSIPPNSLVAVLDSTDLISRLNQAKTSLAGAKVSITLYQINLDKAQKDFERAKIQLQNKIIPQTEFDNAQHKSAASQAELKIAESKIATLESEINSVKTQLSNTKIYSTFGGIVAKKWALTGEVIQPGQPIYSIYETKDEWITAELEETKIASLSIGDPVEIDVDAYPDHKFSGNILKIGTNTAAQFSLIPPSNASGNFTKVTQRIPVKISIKNDSSAPLKYGLLPGMSVEVKIKVAKND